MSDHTIPASADGQRLDRYLKTTFPQVPFVAVQKLIRTGQIRVNGKRAKPDSRLASADVLRLPPQISNAPTKKSAGQGGYQLTNADKHMVKQATLFEDEHLLILNKPARLAAQAGGGHSRSLDRILAAMYGPQNAPKLTHRLDRDTTGLIVLAKTRAAAAHVAEQFKNHTVDKTYLAVIEGQLPAPTGDIHAPLKKIGEGFNVRVVVDESGDPAHTSYAVVREVTPVDESSPSNPDNPHNPYNPFFLITCTPHTGRMNQLRAHLAHIGCPIVGDPKYGPDSRTPDALHLHAWKLTLQHPVTAEALSLEAPLPPHMPTP